MTFFERESKTEQEALQKLAKDITQIEKDKNKVGVYVLAVFAFVFIAASILLAVVMLGG